MGSRACRSKEKGMEYVVGCVWIEGLNPWCGLNVSLWELIVVPLRFYHCLCPCNFFGSSIQRKRLIQLSFAEEVPITTCGSTSAPHFSSFAPRQCRTLTFQATVIANDTFSRRSALCSFSSPMNRRSTMKSHRRSSTGSNMSSARAL